MSQQGETHPRQEDEWWRELYGSPEPGVPQESADTVDDHYASALSAVSTPEEPPVQDEPPVRDDPSALDDPGPPDTLRLRRTAPPTAPQAEPPAAPPVVPSPQRSPEELPPRGGVIPAAGEAWGPHQTYQPQQPPQRQEPEQPRQPQEPEQPREPEWRGTRDATSFGEGPVTWSDPDPGPAPDLPPGWAAAEPLVEEAAPFVGDGPPTYAAEPTAWPVTHPDELDNLVPDTVLDGAHYGVLTLRTVSVRGDSARYRGQPRRDALLTARFGAGDDGLLLLAVASGARAADDAHRAAQDACRWIAGAVGRSQLRLSEDIRSARRGSLKSGLHRLTDRCYGRLRARGEDLGLEEGEYTASLRCLLLPVDPSCRIRLFFGVGDGGLFRIRDGSWQDLDPLRKPSEPEERFRFRASVAHPGDALLLCSAGFAEPLRGEPALAARLAHRWGSGEPPGLTAFLAESQTRVKGYADDRTAVGVWDA
ncbi:protein phosphatase 2C domain-containing protein [Streptomyces sp. H10-C2]|uniref:protein phosphatase 2C domain-containing protein n=1 Tax=unclassified Streptomyces TaxID=2593676 RepID=UPI0024BBAD8E|nr:MULTISPECIES: protein phosphatase 2C domain-containing protein [unclassified Streptomyces]MDJ0340735.1 protein phosphatase 2C domain-containing protein [Streptomyces sp. PH10-H1]MDJ0371993.1 protein phosphatase 2C domain-containing protein [Streptomyces sp. H10-C2]